MTRILTIALFLVALVAAVLFAAFQDHDFVVSDAKLMQMPDGRVMISATVANNGSPDALDGAEVSGFEETNIMGDRGEMVFPAGASPVLASDGVHVVATGGDGFAVGTLVPITLKFVLSGDVQARALVSEPVMDHSGMNGVEATDVTIQVEPVTEIDRTGGAFRVVVEGLEFVSRPNDAEHVDGEGHAHVYLNGLKLQRLYQNGFTIGELLPGSYELRVSLNTNDHRPYLDGDAPIFGEFIFLVR